MSPVRERPLRCPFFCFSPSPVWTGRALSDSDAARLVAAVSETAEAGSVPTASADMPDKSAAVLEPVTALTAPLVGDGEGLDWRGGGILDSSEVPCNPGLPGLSAGGW